MTALIVGLCGCCLIGTVAYLHEDRLSLAVCAAAAAGYLTSIAGALWLGVPL